MIVSIGPRILHYMGRAGDLKCGGKVSWTKERSRRGRHIGHGPYSLKHSIDRVLVCAIAYRLLRT